MSLFAQGDRVQIVVELIAVDTETETTGDFDTRRRGARGTIELCVAGVIRLVVRMDDGVKWPFYAYQLRHLDAVERLAELAR